MKEGYQVKTYCFRLYCQDKEYLQMTKTVYNLVVNFYYDILSKESELESLNRQQKMRQLELMTVGGKEGGNIKYYFPFGKVPLYFRRAAINDAIRLWKSYVSGNEKDERRKPAGNILAYPVFYKGMYKNFTETGICLKLWNGEQWKWIECGLDTSNREFFDPAKALSPMLKLENG
ncbi:MAG: transposase, partial [Acetivibrio ethanolgignens]